MSTRTLLLAAGSCFVMARLAAVTFTDSFNGSSFDSSHWQVTAPFSDSVAAVSGGNAVLANHGTMLTSENYFPAIDITLAFAFTGGAFDSFKIVTRTDATMTNPNLEFDHGLVASFRIRDDTGNAANNISLSDLHWPSGQDFLASGTFALVQNQSYLVRLTDDGVNLRLFINDLANPFLTAASTSSYGQQIGFSNREGAGNGS